MKKILEYLARGYIAKIDRRKSLEDAPEESFVGLQNKNLMTIMPLIDQYRAGELIIYNNPHEKYNTNSPQKEEGDLKYGTTLNYQNGLLF